MYDYSTVEPLIKATPEIGTPSVLKTLHYVLKHVLLVKIHPTIRPKFHSLMIPTMDCNANYIIARENPSISMLANES